MSLAQSLEAARGEAPSDAISRRRVAKWPRLRLLLRMPLPLTAAIILIVLILIAVFAAPFLFEQANRQNLRFRFFEPFQLDGGWLYVLGGDANGRSILAELAYGARTSFFVAGCAVVLSAGTGFVIGLFSGFTGGWMDAVIMRLGDIIVTLPSLLMALAILYVLGPSVGNLIAVISIARLPVFMRTARAQALAIREWTFVEASRSIGAGPWRIIWSDLRPLVAPTILTVAMLELGNIMLAVAGLGFLGVGLQRPDIDWGTMVAEGRQYMQSAWWVTVFPGVAILLTALSANILSNWLRAIADPLQSNVMFATAAGAGKLG
jgi:peptide/nickel transport system permease protein